MAPDSRTVLVVDDNPDIRVALTDILEDEGYGVMHATNGLEALDKLRTDAPRPCVILLDLMMPKMDGAASVAFRSRIRRLQISRSSSCPPTCILATRPFRSVLLACCQSHLRLPP
jgi:CheY-like chemotaxis protein